MKISTLYDVEPILESSRGLSENTKRCAVNAALPQQPVTPFGGGIATSKLRPKDHFTTRDDMAKGNKLASAKKLEKKQTLTRHEIV